MDVHTYRHPYIHAHSHTCRHPCMQICTHSANETPTANPQQTTLTTTERNLLMRSILRPFSNTMGCPASLLRDPEKNPRRALGRPQNEPPRCPKSTPKRTLPIFLKRSPGPPGFFCSGVTFSKVFSIWAPPRLGPTVTHFGALFGTHLVFPLKCRLGWTRAVNCAKCQRGC